MFGKQDIILQAGSSMMNGGGWGFMKMKKKKKKKKVKIKHIPIYVPIHVHNKGWGHSKKGGKGNSYGGWGKNFDWKK